MALFYLIRILKKTMFKKAFARESALIGVLRWLFFQQPEVRKQRG